MFFLQSITHSSLIIQEAINTTDENIIKRSIKFRLTLTFPVFHCPVQSGRKKKKDVSVPHVDI